MQHHVLQERQLKEFLGIRVLCELITLMLHFILLYVKVIFYFGGE